MKYTSLSKLPLRPRIAVCSLYLVAVGLVSAAGWIASDGGNGYILALCWGVQVCLLVHIIRRA